jgi:NitT/TauT family transport system substrate-binding protein
MRKWPRFDRPGRTLRRTGMTLVAAGVAVGIGVMAVGGGGVAQAAASTTTITVGIPPAVTSGALYVGLQEGFFKQHHLNVKLDVLNGGAATVPALQSGAIQIAQSNVLSEAQAAVAGLTVPCFAGAFQAEGLEGLIGDASKGITSAKSLAGKTIAINALDGVNQVAVDAYLAENHVNYRSVHYVSLGFPDMPAALSAGHVDAAVPVEPFRALMLQSGGKLLEADVVSPIKGNPLFSCWNASGSWLSSHAQVAKEFLAAVSQGNSWIASHTTGFQKVMEKDLKVPASVAAKVQLPKFTNAMSDNDVTEWEQAAIKFGILSKTVPVNKVYTPLS